MRRGINKQILLIPSIIIGIFIISQTIKCSGSRVQETYRTDTIITNSNGRGWQIELIFLRGVAHNHPLMAVWITDTNNNYIETLFIAESIGKGVFSYGDKSAGKWLPGAIRRPAALPVWSHNRNVIENDSLFIPTVKTPMPDAITSATPAFNFVLLTKTSSKEHKIFNIYFEINQTWDWNNYWTNNKYPDDEEYKTSCQPALVYMSTLNTQQKNQYKTLELVGHSHYNGSNGIIYPDLSTITTARNITKNIKVKINPYY
jgi:hypothetical protein